ncbi:MAG: bifunctional demethylmenaquinone methyltransferase/2-methoxy-6-polyprenyl-1,4-benzoquinol methylase UbiE [Geitlerinemataceae cyanobacterium]
MTSSPAALDIQSLFDRIAPVYDDFNDWLSFGQHRIWKQMAVKWCGAKPGDVALDLCCGSGDLALRVADAVEMGGMVYGVDFSAALLEIARERSQQLSVPPSVCWMEGDALNLPFEDEMFDAATMGYGLRNLTDIPRGLQELYRVLKPGASAAILDFHRPKSTVMQGFQDWYLQTWVVPAAARFGLTEEYAYIRPSVERFPTGKVQVELARQAQFRHAVHYPISGGMMGVLVATK